MKKLFLCLLIFYSKLLFSQTFEELKQEMGFWIGGSFPAPNSRLEDQLDSSMGIGLFYRFLWPAPFQIEMGITHSNFKSQSMQQLTIVPFYLSLNYPFPIFEKFQFLGKIGVGGSYLEVRPSNKGGVDPVVFVGLEFAIIASKRFKVGLRLDGMYIYEKFRKEPEELKYMQFLMVNYDYRLLNSYNFKTYNGSIYNFGLMVSFAF